MREQINPDEVGWVAGQSADGHGILTGWHGRREMDFAGLVAVQETAEIPREWLPAVKGAAVQLGRACQFVANHVFNAKPVQRKRNASGELPTWTARWSLRTEPTNDEIKAGATYGHVAIVVTLWESDDAAPQLTFDMDPGNWERSSRLREAITLKFNELVGAQRYQAADITKWLGDVLKRRLDAVRYGGNFYVPRTGRDQAERLIEALRATGWGTDWFWPPLPVASSAQLSLGIAFNLQQEVADLMADLEVQRRQARDNGRLDIGQRAIESFVEKANVIGGRITKYEKLDLLNPEQAIETRNVLTDMLILLDSISETLETAA